MVLFSGRLCTVCILNLCLTSSTVLDYCTINMLRTHNYILELKSKTVLLTNCLIQRLTWQFVLEIEVWMNRNMLKLNDDKTEFIVFKSKRNVNTFAEENVQAGSTIVGITSKIKNLGVIFDLTLSMQTHVNTIAKNCFYYLRKIRHIISEEECKIIVRTIMISRLDSCNVLLYGLPRKRLHIFKTMELA